MQYFDTPDGGIQLKMRARVGSGKTFCAVVNLIARGEKTGTGQRQGTPGQLSTVMYSLAGYIAPTVTHRDGGRLADPKLFPAFLRADRQRDDHRGRSRPVARNRARRSTWTYTCAQKEKAVLDCHVTPASTLKVERSSAKGYFAPATPNQTPGADRTFVGTTTRLDKATSTDKSGYKIIFSLLPAGPAVCTTGKPASVDSCRPDMGEDTKWTYKPFLFGGDHIPAFDNTIRPNKVFTKLYCTLSQAAFPMRYLRSLIRRTGM